MSKVEKIKAEIDRLQSSTLDENSNFRSQYDQGIFDGLSLLENFIDSLEQPIKRTPADIEAAMQEVEEKSKLFTETHKDDVVSNDTLKVKYANRIYDVVDCRKLPGEIIYYVIEDEIGHIDYINPDNCEVIEEPVSENMQFAQMADKYEQQVLIGEYQMKESIAHHCRLSYYLGLKDGAQWKKEKMMEDAVDAEVMTGTVIVERETMKSFLKYHSLKTGDKVKLIIIREE